MDELTTGEAAKALGVTPARARQLCDRDQLPGAVKRGRDWFIPPSAIDAYNAGRRPAGNPEWVKKDGAG